MFWPVVAATCTMIGAFLPMLLWPDVTGKFMSYFPITLIVVLSSSMVVALIFLPVLGGLFGKPQPFDAQHEKAIEASETGDWREIPGITGWYAHLAARLTRNPGKVILGAMATVFVVITLFSDVQQRAPNTSSTPIRLRQRAGLGARQSLGQRETRRGDERGAHRLERRRDQVDLRLVRRPEQHAEQPGRRAGGQYRPRHRGDEGLPRAPQGQGILEEIRQKTANIPGVHVEVRVPQSGPPTGKDVMIDVASDDYAAARQRHRHDPPAHGGLPELRDRRGHAAAARHRMGPRHRPRRRQPLRRQCPVDRHGGAARHRRHLVGEYRPDDSDQQVDIRVRYPASVARHPCARRRARGDAGGMVPIEQFRQARAGAAGQFDRARRRPSRLSRPRAI
jgi:multidrug efflux pump